MQSLDVGFFSIFRKNKIDVVRQSEGAECGLACIAMITSYYGHKVDLHTLRKNHAISMHGATLKTILRVCDSLGISTRPVRCELSELDKVKTPAILHWNMNHFVVLSRCTGRFFEIFDPAIGFRRLSVEECSESFTGVAVECKPEHGFEKKDSRKRVELSKLFSVSKGIKVGSVQVAVLSILIEIFTLISPVYLQIIIDKAIPQGDYQLLKLGLVAFGFVLLFDVFAKLLRSITVQFVSVVLSLQMQVSLFQHLLRLPLDWFHKRSVGDIQSKFTSIQPIERFLSSTLIEIGLDGVFGLFVLGMMFFYSPNLTLIVLSSILIYVLFKLTIFSSNRNAEMQEIIAASETQAHFLETLIAMQTVKQTNTEYSRYANQSNRFVKELNCRIKIGYFDIASKFFGNLCDGVSSILILYIGAKYVISGVLSVGMLMVFLVYKQQFSVRTFKLVEHLFSLKMLGVQLERISDIALNKTDELISFKELNKSIEGSVSCKGLSFSYGISDKYVLEGIDLEIGSGEYVAIIGPSGSGKTTLINILTGLYKATDGSVYIDDICVTEYFPKYITRQIAVVSQSDNLFAGSIAQNISSFDQEFDMNTVYTAAYKARIHDEIVQMPMGYNSLVGDMGSALSGGQKQRILIARALYQNPKVLIMDEGTSNLDLDNEYEINEALSSLSITRIVVAHRPETINTADRIIDIGQYFNLPRNVKSEQSK